MAWHKDEVDAFMKGRILSVSLRETFSDKVGATALTVSKRLALLLCLTCRVKLDLPSSSPFH